MTKKYWGIWYKKTKGWWPVFQSDSDVDFAWSNSVGVAKIINNIPIWDDLDKINLLVNRWNPKFWEVREFTPQDALLERCRKHG